MKWLAARPDDSQLNSCILVGLGFHIFHAIGNTCPLLNLRGTFIHPNTKRLPTDHLGYEKQSILFNYSLCFYYRVLCIRLSSSFHIRKSCKLPLEGNQLWPFIWLRPCVSVVILWETACNKILKLWMVSQACIRENFSTWTPLTYYRLSFYLVFSSQKPVKTLAKHDIKMIKESWLKLLLFFCSLLMVIAGENCRQQVKNRVTTNMMPVIHMIFTCSQAYGASPSCFYYSVSSMVYKACPHYPLVLGLPPPHIGLTLWRENLA